MPTIMLGLFAKHKQLEREKAAAWNMVFATTREPTRTILAKRAEKINKQVYSAMKAIIKQADIEGIKRKRGRRR